MRSLKFVICAAALLALTPAHAQDAVDAAKAKAEGKVVWYTSTPIEQAQKIVALFKQQQGIEVELFRSGGSAILRRFQQEMTPAARPPTCSPIPIRRGRHALAQGHRSFAFKPKNFDKVPDAAKDGDGIMSAAAQPDDALPAHRQGCGRRRAEDLERPAPTPNTRASW